MLKSKTLFTGIGMAAALSLSTGMLVFAEPAPSELYVETTWLSGRVEDEETEEITVRYDTVMFQDPDTAASDELLESLQEMSGMEMNNAQYYLDWYKELLSEGLSGYNHKEDFIPCSYYGTALVRRADEAVVSILYRKDAYAGGAHPNTWYNSYNFDGETGEALEMYDVITDLPGLEDALIEQVMKCYPELDATPIEEAYIEAFTWVLDRDGMTIYLGEYFLGGYSDGSQALHISYEEYPELFYDWVLDVDSSLGTELGNFETAWRDLTGEGDMEEITVGMNTGEGTIEENSRLLQVYYNDSATSVSLPQSQALHTTLIEGNGQDYLYIETTNDMDIAWSGVYLLKDGNLQYVGSNLPYSASLYTSHLLLRYPIDLTDELEGTLYAEDYEAEDYSGWTDNDTYDTMHQSNSDWEVYDPEEEEWYWEYTPFYGVWISASKNLEASWQLADLIQYDGVMGWVFVSSDWSNLNPETWYLVTAGVYDTYEEAVWARDRMHEAGYTDAYIKWSGDFIGY